MLQHPGESHLGVGVHRRLERVVPAERQGLDVDLHRRGADRRHLPEMRGHPAGLAPHEAHEVGLADHQVGALPGIGADDSRGERVIPRDRVLSVERGRDGDGEALGELDQLSGRARCANAAAGDEHRPLGLLDRVEGGAGMLGRRCRPEGRRAREQLFGDGVHLRGLLIDLSLIAAHLQVYRPRAAGHGGAKRLAHHVGEPARIVHRRVELRDRLERGKVVQILIGLAELRARVAAAGDGDDGRVGEPGVTQAGGEVEGADHLGHANARTAGGARIAVGHVGGGLLRVHLDAPDPGPSLDLDQGPPQDRRHHEQVRDAVAFEHLRQYFRPQSLRHRTSVSIRRVRPARLAVRYAWTGSGGGPARMLVEG